MKYTEVPPDIQILWLNALKQQNGKNWKICLNDPLSCAFIWGQTEEGQDFWKKIERGEFERSYELY